MDVIWHRQGSAIASEIWAASFVPPAERQWWYAALESGGLEEQFRFYYGEIRNGEGRSLGIVPAFVMDVPIELVAPPAAMRVLRALGPLARPFLHQRTLFVGNVAGEGGSVGLMPGVAWEDVAKCVAGAVWKLRRTEGAKLAVWKDFPRDGTDGLGPTLGKAGYFKIPSYPATRISLPAETDPTSAREAYLKSLSQDYRYKLRKKLKSSMASTPLVAETVRSPADEVRREIWGLFQQTYERGATKFEKFGPAVFDRFAEHEDARWVTLRRANTRQMVAFMLLTKEGDHWVNRFIGMDYDAPKELFLYYRLFVAAVEACAAEPLPYLLSGQTGYRAKLELGHELIPLENFTRHRNPILHRIYAAVGKGITWSTLDDELAVYLKAHPEADQSVNPAVEEQRQSSK